MITVFDAQNYAQQWFFDKAFTELKNKGYIVAGSKEDEIGRFTSLEGYFAHMEDLLIGLASPQYAMIPSDEQPFVITANDRSISVPTNFSKCAGVVGDEMCEIITFTVDRYFDYVDLAETNICIQWETKKGKGISHIGLIDYETIPDKIRFGWPLTSALTEEAGNITFAVRFFEKGTVTIDDEQVEKYVYILNTKKAVIPIIEGLSISEDDKDVIVEHNVNKMFEKFISNSTNPSYTMPAAVFFNATGLDLDAQSPAQISLEDDNLILEAQAIVSDNGWIEYVWHYVAPDGTDYDLEANTEASFTRRFKIDNKVYKPVAVKPDGSRNGSEQYYKQVTDNDGKISYQLVIDEKLPTDITLYERFATLEIQEFSEEDKVNYQNDYQSVTGKYYVEAINNTGSRKVVLADGTEINAINATTPKASSYCIVPTPNPVELTKDLDEDVFTVNGTATLIVEAKADPGKPHRTFTWHRSENKEDMSDAQILTGETLQSLVTQIPGWYRVDIDSQLNRKIEEKSSTVCRVVNPVEAPHLVKMEFAPWTDAAYENPEEYFARADVWQEVTEEQRMPDTVVTAPGQAVRLRIQTRIGEEDSTTNQKLLSDKIEYEWYVIEPDATEERAIGSDPSDLDENNNGLILWGSPTDENYIDVLCQTNQIKDSYFCKVTNTLAKESKAIERADYKVLFEVW